jgi:hypothetical protein
MGALDLLDMIIWENLKHFSDEQKNAVKICESCTYLGEYKNCTKHECGCFITSIISNNMKCPLSKW